MDYNLTEEQQAIVETAREIAQKKIKKVREHYDKTEEYPWEIVEEMRKADLFGVYIPQEYGGLGGGVFELVLAMEEISKACAGMALAIAGTALGTYPIMLYGNDAQKKKYLPDLASGKRMGAFTITEPDAGSDATATKATARLEGNHYVLNGTKVFCTNGKAAEIYALFFSTNPARGARGISAFIVEKGTPGFEFGRKEEKMGIRASPTYALEFNNCKIPKENLLGREGGGLMVAQATFDVSRPGVAAQALGIAQGAMDEAFAYARQRRQFGQPVISFQAMQHKLANMAMEIEAARALLYQVARAIDKGGDKRFTKESAMVKCFCSDVAMRVSIEAVQMCGGIGYMRDFPVEKYMRDAKITQIYEGTNEIQRNEIAMMMIKEAAREGLGKK
ncbi:MAG: acyl-CoA dehydrogenase family protein [Elusimicrobiota bacterium]|jgi:alkylation response protein AidB-like acyl-CoA dehydrogenase